jgi:hypothetical protein
VLFIRRMLQAEEADTYTKCLSLSLYQLAHKHNKSCAVDYVFKILEFQRAAKQEVKGTDSPTTFPFLYELEKQNFQSRVYYAKKIDKSLSTRSDAKKTTLRLKIKKEKKLS